jgi:hypothetical protein
MRIAYIIHAYKLPLQLRKLVESLKSDNSHFFIHIDKKVDISIFEEAFSELGEYITWVNREYSNWGTIGSVQAVINSLSLGFKHEKEFDYFYLLSGQDYPIKPTATIEKFFENNKDKDYMKYFPLPSKEWKGGGVHRYSRYHFIVSKNRYIRRLFNIINFFLPRKKTPYGMKLYGGEFYLGLSRPSVTYLLDFISTHPDYVPYFKYAYIPEEAFFQTILLNSICKDKIINETLTYVDWSKPFGPYPATLTLDDFHKIQNSNKLFARKFDMDTNIEIINKIDTEIRNKP